MRWSKKSIISAIIGLIVVMAGYAIAADSEDVKVRGVVDVFYAGYKTENLDLLMSTISRDFLMSKFGGKTQNESVTAENDAQGETALVGYEQFKETNRVRFENWDNLEVNVEINKIEIKDNAAEVETVFKAKEISKADSHEVEVSRSPLIILNKKDNTWLITSIQNK